MASKPLKDWLIISKIPTNRQKINTDWSQQMYVHINIKKRAISGAGGRGVDYGRGLRGGHLDKPHILAIQGVTGLP